MQIVITPRPDDGSAEERGSGELREGAGQQLLGEAGVGVGLQEGGAAGPELLEGSSELLAQGY